jgi:type I restriction enzyme S subunit
MSFPRYQAYKDSGVEWLGEVPVHWETHPFKWEIKRNDGGVWGLDPDGLDDTIVLRSTEQTIDGKWRLDDPAFRKLTHVERNTTLLEEGDLVVTKSSGSSAHIGKTTIVGAELASMGCCFSNFMQRIRLQPGFHPRLAWYAMNNELMRKQFDYFSNTTTGLANLNATLIGMAMAPVPTNGEQKQIVAFLDRETAKIDALIAEQQRLIELLQEKRQAVISHAVTKGLNPDAPMKDSGVEWLGEVPEHWEVTALKRLCLHITDGAHISPETENGVYCFVSTRDISESGIDFEGCLQTSESSYEYLLRTGCRPEVGDILFSKDGTIGRTLVVREHHDFVVASSLIIIRPDTELLDAEFLDFLCKSDAVQDQVESFVKGAGLPRLSIANLMRVIGIFPPLQEQRRIANIVSKISVRFTVLMAEAEAAVTLLQERRSALISAAVTGQIDVRGLFPETSPA